MSGTPRPGRCRSRSIAEPRVAAGYSHTPTGSVPDVADHPLANSSVWYAVVAALLFPMSFRWRGHLGNRAAIGAVVAMVFPPWIIPGAGVIVLASVRSLARARNHRFLDFTSASVSAVPPPTLSTIDRVSRDTS